MKVNINMDLFWANILIKKIQYSLYQVISVIGEKGITFWSLFQLNYEIFRFNYVKYDPKHGKIHESIQKLDKAGMDAIESQNSK